MVDSNTVYNLLYALATLTFIIAFMLWIKVYYKYKKKR